MSSKATRSEIVLRSLKQAGRGVELKTHANDLLNDLLRSWALEHRYPNLRKVGAQITLPAGQQTVAFPSDFGAGMDNLLFGVENQSLVELSIDDFIAANGFPPATASNSRPLRYFLDHEARLIRFDHVADQSYPMTPIYFKVPDRIPNDSSGDNVYPWFDDEAVLVEGLIAAIYQYTGDQREFLQLQKADKLRRDYRRGAIPMGGGTTRMNLSRARFKRT